MVLHIDFWNTLEMSEEEIRVMQYVYDLKGKFRKQSKSHDNPKTFEKKFQFFFIL